MEENRKKALAAALSQIEKQFGKGSVMRLGDAGATYEVESIPTGSLGLDIALGVGGIPRGRVIEIFGPESSGKTTLTLPIIASAQKQRRHRGVRRRRACARSGLRGEARRQGQRPAGLAAGHRRAGARDHRHAGALGRGRRGGGRLGRRAHAEGGDRGRDGRSAHGPAGAPDVAGAAQADRQHQALEHHRDFHQPDPHEDRRDVRQSRNHHRRQRAEVLFLGAHGHPPHRRDQERRGSGRHR